MGNEEGEGVTGNRSGLQERGMRERVPGSGYQVKGTGQRVPCGG